MPSRHKRGQVIFWKSDLSLETTVWSSQLLFLHTVFDQQNIKNSRYKIDFYLLIKLSATVLIIHKTFTHVM